MLVVLLVGLHACSSCGNATRYSVCTVMPRRWWRGRWCLHDPKLSLFCRYLLEPKTLHKCCCMQHELEASFSSLPPRLIKARRRDQKHGPTDLIDQRTFQCSLKQSSRALYKKMTSTSVPSSDQHLGTCCSVRFCLITGSERLSGSILKLIEVKLEVITALVQLR